eukprot:GFUD01070264.1.p1 GENE.GFUD01070264.1~~GFUD01070264.1.p1  ORF type:complete len:935 (-),score=111.94 GFUD01070264.1:1839-4643(-)
MQPIIVLVLYFLTGAVSGFSRRRKELPISFIDTEQDGKPKASECRFGGESYELEQTWHPDLGPPFGIMYCVHCECVPIHKKRRIVGRVRCKNIKTECPKPTCPDPVLLPGRCCKVCPGQDDNPDLTITVDLEREEQEKNGRHYAAVLTGPGVPRAATGRFYFRKKTLQYSFLFGEELGWPTSLTFLDNTNNILEEFALTKTALQNRTEKLCGAWARLPRRYRRTLRSEDMAVSLSTDLGTISGKVMKYYGLSSELFSGLLEGPSGAGTAIVSVSPGTGSIHVNILFKGIVKEGEQNIHFIIKFQMSHDGETRSVEEAVVLESVGPDLSTIEIRTVFDSPELGALGRGELTLWLAPTLNPSRILTAKLVPRLSCDIFDCVLQPAETPSGDANGIAFLYFTRAGGLQYNIKVETMDKVVDLNIDNGKKSKRLLTVIDGLMSTYANGWANGTAMLNAGQVDELFKENLYLNVATENDAQALRGRLVTHLAGPSESSGEAVMMKGEDSSISGVAWASLDDTCRLHYNIRLEGSELDTSSPSLELEDYPIQNLDNLKALPLFPSTKRHLQDCRGKKCSGHADNIHKLMMARLDSGDAAFLMTNAGQNEFVLKGQMLGISSPQACLPRYARNDLEIMPGYLRDLGEEIGDEDLAENMRQKCAYEGSFYEDGNRWEATHDKCKMCSCQRGKVDCEPIVCPPTNCSNPIIEEGECCATCNSPSVDGRGCNFGGDSLFHPAGSKWHPYIPPFGFSRCAVCTCKESSLAVDCYREECPPLTACLHSEAIRPNPLACCKVCPKREEKSNSVSKAHPVLTADPHKLNDMAMARTGLDILASGGCSWKGVHHENGVTWHPTVMPWGEMKCVTCGCKDGQTQCKKKHCPKLTCSLKIRDQDQCCPRCAANREEEERAQRTLLISNREQRKLKRLKRLRNIRNQERTSG